jgi:hypothetical protein
METVLKLTPKDKVGRSIVRNLGDTVKLVEIVSRGPGGVPAWKLQGIDQQETWVEENQKHLKFFRLQ